MQREEWYKHRTLDHLQALSEYVEIMMDGAMDSDLSEVEIQAIYHGLCVLNLDISNQLKRFDS